MDARTFRVVAAILAIFVSCGCGGGTPSGGLDAALEDGWKAFSTGDFDFAVNCFKIVESADAPALEQTYSALLGLATCHHLRPNPDLARARSYYVRLAELDTDAARAQSLLGLGRLEMAAGKPGQGQSELMSLMQDYPDRLEASEAAVHLADSLFRPHGDDAKPGEFTLAREAAVLRGLETLEAWLGTHPDDLLASAMHIMLANKYIEMSDFEKAVEHLVAADEAGIAGVKTRSVTLWRIARIAQKELKDYELAETYYARYVAEFERTVLFYRAAKSLERVQALRAGQGV